MANCWPKAKCLRKILWWWIWNSRTASASRALGDEEMVYRALVLGTRDYLHKCGFKSAVLGLSGGIDSALTAAIAAEALGRENVRGVALPSQFSSQGSLDDARKLAENLGIGYDVIPIQPMFVAAKEQLKSVFANRAEDTTEENIQARLRGVILMAMSNKFGSLLLTTGNKSELAVGYCTLYGDMCGGLAVISDVPKTMVYRISRWFNRDREIIPPDYHHQGAFRRIAPGSDRPGFAAALRCAGRDSECVCGGRPDSGGNHSIRP